MKKEILQNLSLILTVQELKQFRFIETKDGLIVRFDTHGKSVKMARQLINNVAASYRKQFFIHVIHGFHNGTAIRDMIWNDNINPRFISIKYQKNNPGTSIIKVASAFPLEATESNKNIKGA